jgi:broad specificity phosphatase PhoE
VNSLPQIHIVRHGQTAWALTGQHTGRSDVPLTPVGEEEARKVGRRLAGMTFSRVFSSPSQRARRTCEIAGFAAGAIVEEDLAEWDYGKYEGLTTAEIRQLKPDWEIFRDGVPGGETLADISARADRVVARLKEAGDQPLVFSSGHFLRILAARWLGQDAAFGKLLMIGTASLGILSYEHSLADPAIALWNERGV